jgi:hypothetical protein
MIVLPFTNAEIGLAAENETAEESSLRRSRLRRTVWGLFATFIAPRVSRNRRADCGAHTHCDTSLSLDRYS